MTELGSAWQMLLWCRREQVTLPALPRDPGEPTRGRRTCRSRGWIFEEGRAEAAFDDGIEFALRFLLASPPFLVRAEREPETVRAGEPYRIDDIELASRLSFFLR